MMKNVIDGLCNRVQTRFRANMLTVQAKYENISTLEYILRIQKQGCGHVTRLLLEEERKHWRWGQTPRAFSTYVQDNLINIDSSDYMRSLGMIRKNSLLPSIQWTSLTIMLRTTWTKVKQAKNVRCTYGPADIGCSNCGTDIETTSHLMYFCPLATSVWDALFRMFNTQIRDDNPDNQNMQIINHSIDSILFHYLPGVKKEIRIYVIELLMLTKHIIYRLKFRDDMKFPTHKRVILLIVIELEKLISCRKAESKQFSFLFNIQNSLREHIGMGTVEDI